VVGHLSDKSYLGGVVFVGDVQRVIFIAPRGNYLSMWLRSLAGRGSFIAVVNYDY
jgi:hypothetical protein